MKKIYWTLVLFIQAGALFVFSPALIEAADDKAVFEMPRYFDANNQEITPYTKEEYVEKVLSALEDTHVQKSEDTIGAYSVSRPNYYDTYGYAGYRNFVWINKGKTYRNPIYINFEILNRTTGKAIYFYNSAGTFQGKVIFPKYGNIWYVANIDYLVRGVSYKFKLVSESGEFSEIKHGNIAYDG